MGKTPKPLRLLVHPDIADLPEFQALREQGHTVDTGMPSEWNDTNAWAYDAILGPTSWRMTHAHIKYLPLTIVEARKRRYPQEKKS